MYLYMTLTQKRFRLMVYIFSNSLGIGVSRVVSIGVVANRPASDVTLPAYCLHLLMVSVYTHARAGVAQKLLNS